MIAVSSNQFATDTQIADALSYLSNSTNPALRALSDRFVGEFPEYNTLKWAGSWVDPGASGVDPDYMMWVADWIEANTPISWEEGEPWDMTEELAAAQAEEGSQPHDED